MTGTCSVTPFSRPPRPRRSANALPGLALILCTALLPVSSAKQDYSPVQRPRGLETSPLSTVSAVAGGAVLLPCDVTPPTPNGNAMLVLIFRGDTGTPIYSIDGRNTSLYNGQHWADPEQLQDRASFRTRPGQQGLLLNPLTPGDEGQYRCRVDFKNSPSKNIRVQLSVVVPPQSILILSPHDGDGELGRDVVGPYPEGTELQLACQVSGGWPRPSVVWWEAGSLLDSTPEQLTEHLTLNTLTLGNITRTDFLRTFTCLASNNNMTVPLSAKVVLDIAFPPASINIIIIDNDKKKTVETSNQDNDPEVTDTGSQISLKSGHEYHLTCESSGSRPIAEIQWYKNGRLVDPESIVHQEEEADPLSMYTLVSLHSTQLGLNATSSKVLRFVPSPEDDGSVLTCKASNLKLQGAVKEESIHISVLYAPVVSVQYHSPAPLTNLEEGDAFSLHCAVSASPPTPSVQWFLDGAPLPFTSSLMVRGFHLEAARTTRALSGRYTCTASNSVGTGTSAPVHIRVKFVPTCAINQTVEIGTGLNQEVSVPCTVDSFPPPLSFRWAFNKSSNVITDIPQSSYSSSGLTSTLRYTANTVLDFGTLLCWAANDVGLMKEPCVINIVPAGKPEPVHDCEIQEFSTSYTTDAVLACQAGWDGGRNQSFALEVRDEEHKHSAERALVKYSTKPVFSLIGLTSGARYLLVITAFNDRAVSDPVSRNYTSRPVPSATYSGPETFEDDFWHYLWVYSAVIFGLMLTIMFMSCVAYAVTKSCLCHCKRKPSSLKDVIIKPLNYCRHGRTKSHLVQNGVISCGNPCCEDEDWQQRSSKDSDIGSLDSCIKPPMLSDHLLVDQCPQPPLLGDHQVLERYMEQDSGCDTRGSTPCYFNLDSSSSCGGSYFRDSGPYHPSSLSPPTPCPSTSPLLHSEPAHPSTQYSHHHTPLPLGAFTNTGAIYSSFEASLGGSSPNSRSPSPKGGAIGQTNSPHPHTGFQSQTYQAIPRGDSTGRTTQPNPLRGSGRGADHVKYVANPLWGRKGHESLRSGDTVFPHEESLAQREPLISSTGIYKESSL